MRTTAAAVAANQERIARKLPGTLQVFSTPAEEILIGKTFMIMAGAFNKQQFSTFTGRAVRGFVGVAVAGPGVGVRVSP